MKLKKKILSGLIIFLLVIVIVVGVVIMYLDSIVASSMRTIGTKATGTELKVKSVYLSLHAGNMRINQLAIANPAGYKLPDAFKVEKIFVDLDVNSLFTDTIIVEKVEISNVLIDFEPTLNGSNLNDIKNNIMKFAAKDKAASEKAEKTPEKADDSKKSKKIIIKSFVITKGTVMVSSDLVPKNVSVTLNKIKLTDIGEKNAMGEVFVQIIDVILEQVALDVAAAKIEGLGQDVLKSKILKDLPSSAEKVGKEIGEDVGKSLKDLGNKLFK